MSHLVKIANGLTNVEVGSQYGDAGDILTITDEEYASIAATSLDGNPLIDLGEDITSANVLSIPIDLTAIPAGAGDVVTNLPLQGHGKITQFVLVVTAPGAGAGATRAFNLEIGSPGTNVTGGVVTATLANTATEGAVIASTAITANNTFNDGDVLSIEVAGGTVFTGGRVAALITIE